MSTDTESTESMQPPFRFGRDADALYAHNVVGHWVASGQTRFGPARIRLNELVTFVSFGQEAAAPVECTLVTGDAGKLVLEALTTVRDCMGAPIEERLLAGAALKSMVFPTDSVQ